MYVPRDESGASKLEAAWLELQRKRLERLDAHEVVREATEQLASGRLEEEAALVIGLAAAAERQRLKEARERHRGISDPLESVRVVLPPG